jgi:hypothetical protein
MRFLQSHHQHHVTTVYSSALQTRQIKTYSNCNGCGQENNERIESHAGLRLHSNSMVELHPHNQKKVIIPLQLLLLLPPVRSFTRSDAFPQTSASTAQASFADVVCELDDLISLVLWLLNNLVDEPVLNCVPRGHVQRPAWCVLMCAWCISRRAWCVHGQHGVHMVCAGVQRPA